jgi:hypothetical protein
VTYATLSRGGTTYRLISQLTYGPNKAGLFGSHNYTCDLFTLLVG